MSELDDIVALRLEIEALEADQKRYRFLATQIEGRSSKTEYTFWFSGEGKYHYQGNLRDLPSIGYETFDDAVDAAMKDPTS